MIVVGTTLTAFAMDDPGTWGAWLHNAEEMQRLGTTAGYEVKFFAAIEVDTRGLAPFTSFLDRLTEIGGEHWTFMLDDGRDSVTSGNRHRHIVMGQNLVSEYALSVAGAAMTHTLFIGADMEPPADCLGKLLELDHALVGGDCPTYGFLPSTPVDLYPDLPGPVVERMATGAFHLIARPLMRRLRWRWDLESGWTDDAALYNDAHDLFGVPTYIRRDVVARHYPQSIGPIESRHSDMTVHRAID